MIHRRSTALWLAAILAAFSALVAGELVAIHLDEQEAGVLTSTELIELKAQLYDSPKDESIKENIRDLDVRARQDYYRNRDRFRWAGYLLLAALAGLIASGRRYFELAPDRSGDAVMEKRSMSPRSRSVAALVGVAGIVAVVLIIGSFMGGPKLPTTDMTQGMDGGEVIDEAALFLENYYANWPCFRGPDNLGIATTDGDWPTSWSVEPRVNIVWETTAPVHGLSSPIIWGDRLFLTGADEVAMEVACLDRETGDVLWITPVDIDLGDEEFEVWEDTGFAAPTPVTDGKRVYAMFACGVLAAFDFDGRQVWIKNLGIPDSAYGFSASLIEYEGVVILQFDQGMDNGDEALSKLIGFEAETGRRKWITHRPVPGSWSSPSLIRTDEFVTLVTTGDPWVIGYDPSNGQEKWRLDGLAGDIAPSPAYAGGDILVTNDAAETLAIPTGGSGDITETHIKWDYDDGLPDTSSPVIAHGRAFLVAPGGMFVCLDMESGELIWEVFIESGATASPILAGDLIHLACEDGMVRVIDIRKDKYEVVDHGDMLEPLLATPAFLDGRIYLRGEGYIVCVGKTQ